MILMTILLACAEEGNKKKGGDGDDWTGCAAWENWSCSVASSGCQATCDDWQVVCNGSGLCNWDEGSCSDIAATECDACQEALESCFRSEI